VQEQEWLSLHEALSVVGSDRVFKSPFLQLGAWGMLQRLIADGTVRARGARLERRGNHPAREHVSDGGAIPPEEVEALSLVPRDDGALWLGRTDGRPSLDGEPATFWIGVTVSRADLAAWGLQRHEAYAGKHEAWLSLRGKVIRKRRHDTPAAPPIPALAQSGDALLPTAPTAPAWGGGARPARRRGRQKRSGSYERWDAPLLDEMMRLIVEGHADSVEHAAKLVARKAHGTATYESKFTRLAKLFRKKYPNYIDLFKSV
jgi:hypothetical protein